MATAKLNSQPKFIWVNITFFLIITLVTLIGAPLYLIYFKFTPFLAGLTIFYTIATGMGITVGYHRLFSHVSFNAHPLIQFFFLFFGAAAFEQSCMTWSSQHRDHHRYVDTDLDPYSIKKGFWYAHVGWLIFWKHTVHYDNAPDLQKNTLVAYQHKYYYIWASFSGIILPTLIGAFYGQALGAFIFAVCARLVLVYNATFCINSVCHMFGKATYDIYSTAKDHWLVALITNGEGYHNFHHRFPSDYRNGVRWYQWDPSKWLIAFLNFFRLSSDLKRTSRFRILEAKLKADQQRVRDWVLNNQEPGRLKTFQAEVEERFRALHHHLILWEKSAKAYSDVVRGRLQENSAALRNFSKKNADAAKDKFQQAQNAWQLLIKSRINLALF